MKNQYELVRQFHHEIDTFADNTISHFEKKLQEEFSEQDKLNLELRKRGFRRTTVDSFRKQTEKEEIKKRLNDLNYYKQKYPQYKFIFYNDLKKIIEFYGLILSKTNNFKGEIPLKNQLEILNAKVDILDSELVNSSDDRSEEWVREIYEVLKDEWIKEQLLKFESVYCNHPLGHLRSLLLNRKSGDRITITSEFQPKTPYFFSLSPLRIVAPVDQFELGRNEKIENNEIIKTDPVVLWKVGLFSSSYDHGYLIISKWGPEAEIKEFHNEKEN